MISLIEENTANLKEDFRQNLGNIITSQVYESYAAGCRACGTFDVVVLINAEAPEGDIARNGLVYSRTELTNNEQFPAGIRERISEPARVSTHLTGVRMFWAIVLWNQSVTALAIAVKEMSLGGDA